MQYLRVCRLTRGGYGQFLYSSQRFDCVVCAACVVCAGCAVLCACACTLRIAAMNSSGGKSLTQLLPCVESKKLNNGHLLMYRACFRRGSSNCRKYLFLRPGSNCRKCFSFCVLEDVEHPYLRAAKSMRGPRTVAGVVRVWSSSHAGRMFEFGSFPCLAIPSNQEAILGPGDNVRIKAQLDGGLFIGLPHIKRALS